MRPELLSPAGDWDCLRAAVANGADAVYFGLPRFNARLRADNFREDELPEIMRFLHRHGVKGYVAFNTLVFTGELPEARVYLHALQDAGVDAIIVQDPGLARLAKRHTPGLALHASTQMTITSPEGARFVAPLGLDRIVLARELSLREIGHFKPGDTPPLEVFVHGALCVAYSGQCLTSEALGQRSANRGECAQACRMPYDLIVDGAHRDLGDRRYLLSPQDLAAVAEIPALIAHGVVGFKIEGRLKSPEYVAAVTRVYRRAIDTALENQPVHLAPEARYALEMTFSRGFFTGWLHGVNHQHLVGARFGKKRGPFAGRVLRVGSDHVEIRPEIPLAPGDGVVFDTGGDTNEEQGGRLFSVRGGRLGFAREHLDFSRIRPGDRVWKTSDPVLDKELRRTFSGRLEPRRQPVRVTVRGRAGGSMQITMECAGRVETMESAMPLETARTAPLHEARLREHIDRFGDAPFFLESLDNRLESPVLLPLGEINRMRRELAVRLESAAGPRAPARGCEAACSPLREERDRPPRNPPDPAPTAPVLSVLCRSMEQVRATLDAGEHRVLVDFEDVRRCRDAVSMVREVPGARVLLATPRIQKSGEAGFFRLIENAAPDGVLLRNLGAIGHFREWSGEKCGDFSLNIANPLSAQFLMESGLDRLTISYDLDIAQVLELLRAAPPAWFELTIHQHIPMFHMEHCVFAAFLSGGKDHTDCGRPCDRHRVHLRDRTGVEHPLRADVGCRNTLFNAVAQTGAAFYPDLHAAGLRHFRVELLEEDAAGTAGILASYRGLLDGREEGAPLWRKLRARTQLGVTRGTLRPAAG